MSVILYSDLELRSLARVLIAQCATAPAAVRDDTNGEGEADLAFSVSITLTALGVANRAAYLMNYCHEAPMLRPDLSTTLLETEIEQARDAETLARWGEQETPQQCAATWLSNLLYNTVTNAGTDFAPETYATRARRWVDWLRAA